MSIRTEYRATYFMPGVFMPEEITLTIPEPSIAAIADARPEPDWYAANVKGVDLESVYLTYSDTWRDIEVGRRHCASYVIGIPYHYTELEEGTILRWNAEHNGGYAVKTRLGNWQPRNGWDFVISPDFLDDLVRQ